MAKAPFPPKPAAGGKKPNPFAKSGAGAGKAPPFGKKPAGGKKPNPFAKG